MVECTALERRHTEIPYRGFESLPFRQNTDPEASQAPGFFFIYLEYQAHSRILLSSIPPKSARLRHITPCDRLWRWVFWWVFFRWVSGGSYAIHRPKVDMKDQVTSKNFMTLPPGRYSLGGGLMLLVRSESSRQWVVRYRFAGTRKDLSIGGASRISITSAKARAAKILSMAADGIDPSSSKLSEEDARESITFKEFYSGAIATIQNVKRWKNEKHASQWVSTIETYAVPVLGALRVKDITRGDILEVLKPIWTEKPETASRLRGRLESLFSQAIAEELIQTNPATWKDGLAFFLPPISKVHEIKHHEAMPLAELKAFAPDISTKASVVARATLFGILTATRAQEFLGARWDEINFDDAIWTIPATRMKCGIEHRVPLSKQAIAVLERSEKTGELIFPAPRSSSKEMVIDSPRAFIRKATGTTATMHGMRSTFRDWCEENFIHEALAERSLAHINSDKVLRAYQRSDLLEQRRPVMQQWADAIMPKKE